jgi:uncharacterized phage-associated protein
MAHSELSKENEGLDPRIVANYIIEKSSGNVRHIALQKLIYFSHCLYLIRFKRPLIKGYFEAWTYGPVHPAVYTAFKDQGSSPIKKKALRKDIRTGMHTELPKLEDIEAQRVINLTLTAFEGLSDSQLVELSHAEGGPWDIIKKKSQHEKLIGLKIPNDLIVKEFRNHKVSSHKLTYIGDLDDQQDTPLAYHGLG